MAALLRYIAARPWPFLSVLALMSLLAGFQLPRLQIDVSPQSLSIEGDEARAFYRRTVDVFGGDNITILFIKDPNLFAPDRLRSVHGLISELEALPYVVRTESLFSLPNLRTDDEGYIHTEAYLATIPDTPLQATAVRTAALKNPFVRRNLLSEDGTAMAVNVYIDDSERKPGFDQAVFERFEQALAPLRKNLAQVFQIGLPSIRSAISERIRADQRTILPLSVVVLLLSLALTLRRIHGALIPLLSAGISILWTLGLMAALGLTLNVMTAIVPVLLVIIGSTEDIHLVSEYYKGRAKGRLPEQALRRMAANLGLTVLLTFATTYLGFLSISVNPIELLREFGLVASTALLFNFLVTICVGPIYLRYFAEQRLSPAGYRWQVFYERLIGRITGIALDRRWMVILLTLGMAAIAGNGMLSLRVNNNLLDYVRDGDPTKQMAEILHRELAGIETVTVVVDGRIQGTFQKIRYLEQLHKIQHYLAQNRHFDTSLSLADYVAQLHSVVNETGEPELPQFDEELAELLMFVKHEHIRGYVSDDFSRATLVLRHSVGDSETLTRALAGLEAFAAKALDPGLEVRVTGESVLSSRAADYITVGQIKSLGLMLLVIFVVIGLLFANVRAGLLAIVPNVFPIIILFGVMGYAGIPLDTGTALIAAIAIGICVDNTMHFMVRYNRELRRHRSEMAAIDATLRAEAMPITATSVSLALGFATMALSSFTPVAYFGLLSAMVMLLAFYADFFITPVLLSSTRLLTLWDLLALNLRNDLQDKCALFEGMRPNQIKRIVLNGNLRQFHAGETVMRQGEIGRELFVLLEGEGELSFPTRNKRLAEIRGLRRGDVFGVLAVVSEHARCASVMATTDVKVLALDWLQIRAIARSCPYSTSLLFCNLTRLVSERYSLHISKDQGAEQFSSARQPLSAQVFHESTTETQRTEKSQRAEVEVETASS